MGVLDMGGDCGREGAILRVNVGHHPIVTIGDFVVQLFSAMRHVVTIVSSANMAKTTGMPFRGQNYV